ncbi:hypothetical protein KDM41_12940, partial [bacterium]|nr:hypothetical protein [bacterium]
AAEPTFAAATSPATAPDPTLTGRLLLPAGADGRDLSVVASVRDADGTPRDIWARVTPDGHFTRPLPGELRGVRILAGIGVDLLVLAGPDLPAATATGIDLGALDLTATVVARRIVMPPGPAGVLRAAPHLGPIPTDPLGAMVSLGSAQFRELAPGAAVVWLFPPDAADIHILVEHPADARRGREWRTGRQEVFGPYPLEGVPGVLGGE